MQARNNVVDEFARLHGLFVFHFGVAVSLAWLSSLYAACHAPWVRNIRALIDPSPSVQVESTGAFLFGLPLLMTFAWLSLAFGGDLLRRMQTIKNQSAEFALAGAAAFAVFYMAVERAVTATLLGG